MVKVIGPESALVLAAIASGTASALATRMAPSVVAPEPVDSTEADVLRGDGIVHATEAMGLLRGVVGFLTFLLAFDLKGGGNDAPVPVGLAIGRAARHAAGFPNVGTGHPSTAPAWHFGAVLVASVAGALLGALIAPRLRLIFSEERILVGALGIVAAGGLACALQGGLVGSAGCALVVGFGASAGRLAFDAIVQRDAPDANFGRSFARFETRFQLLWVIGAFPAGDRADPRPTRDPGRRRGGRLRRLRLLDRGPPSPRPHRRSPPKRDFVSRRGRCGRARGRGRRLPLGSGARAPRPTTDRAPRVRRARRCPR